MLKTESRLAPMVARLALHSPLGSEERRALLGLPHRLANLDRSSFIAREGDVVDRCCLLLSGFAYRHKGAGSGARQILSIHVAGDLVDLSNILLPSAEDNVQPLVAAQVAFIPRDAMLAVASAFPQVARAFWKETALVGAVLGEWLLSVGRRDARQRISHLLCELALRQEAAGQCAGPAYAWPMTQEQIGDATGLTSVHVNRTLQGLRADGLLRTEGREVIIVDWHGLQEAGDFTRSYLHLPERSHEASPLERAQAPAGFE